MLARPHPRLRPGVIGCRGIRLALAGPRSRLETPIGAATVPPGFEGSVRIARPGRPPTTRESAYSGLNTTAAVGEHGGRIFGIDTRKPVKCPGRVKHGNSGDHPIGGATRAGASQLTQRRAFRPAVVTIPKEHLSMSRIAKGLALTSVAAAAVAGTAGIAAADSGASAAADNSPGVLSGNVVQVPIHVPVNVCGNTIDVVGLLNPAFGNTCANG